MKSLLRLCDAPYVVVLHISDHNVQCMDVRIVTSYGCILLHTVMKPLQTSAKSLNYDIYFVIGND